MVKRGLGTLANIRISSLTEAHMILNALELEMVNSDEEFKSPVIVGMPMYDWQPLEGASKSEIEKCERENEERRQAALVAMRKHRLDDGKRVKYNVELWQRKYLPRYYYECGKKGIPLEIAMKVYGR